MREGAYLVGGSLWCLLFAFGTIRLLIEREWGYAAASALMLAVFAFGSWNSYRTLKSTQAEDPAAAHRRETGQTPDPIE